MVSNSGLSLALRDKGRLAKMLGQTLGKDKRREGQSHDRKDSEEMSLLVLRLVPMLAPLQVVRPTRLLRKQTSVPDGRVVGVGGDKAIQMWFLSQPYKLVR